MSEKIVTVITVIGLLFVCGAFIWMFYYLIAYANYGTLQGIVVDKQYSTETAYTEYITNSGDKIPYQKYIAEKYKIEIQKTVNRKQKSIWIEVPKEEYNNLTIGDSYNDYKEE